MGKTFDGAVTEGPLQALAEVAGKKLSKERASHGSDSSGDTDNDDLAEGLQAFAGHDE
jgi:hypothetical protein